MAEARFRFVDLFAGIGGFHAAMTALGGKCVYAVEIDPKAAHVYRHNWGLDPLGDITADADADTGTMNVPEHDVLCAGFPCQPFSKSGAQRGMDEARGTLFFNIASIIKARHPKVVLLENVRNLIGPRHRHEWEVIIETLRDEGYLVSSEPAIFSPHLLPPRLGGTPQVRERVFITATHAPHLSREDLDGWPVEPVARMTDRFPATDGSLVSFDPRHDWDLESVLHDAQDVSGCGLSDAETHWIDAWDEFVRIMRERMNGRHLPGHPIWAQTWLDFPEVQEIDWTASSVPHVQQVSRPAIDHDLPDWKRSHITKNHDLFQRHFEDLIPWAHRWGVFTESFTPSRRKLEWQAQDTKSLWDTVMHLRPSGIRAKRPTYLPALVAITQTSIIGPRGRRLSPREAARLQGLPDTFEFPDQRPSDVYRQMGNAVAVGAVWHVMKSHILRDKNILRRTGSGRRLLNAVSHAPESPSDVLVSHRPARPIRRIETFPSSHICATMESRAGETPVSGTSY